MPFYIPCVFILTTLLTLALFCQALRKSGRPATRKRAGIVAVFLLFWLVVQAALSVSNFYSEHTMSLPPRILLAGLLPPVLLMIFLFASFAGRRFIDSLPMRNLTYLNIIRIPIELVLLWLSVEKAVPVLMTFEGRNFDVFSGITAPVVGYLYFEKRVIGRKTLLAWNLVCLGLLLNIVVNALLSAPSPLQRFAFDQPNTAIFHFPFVWLPAFVVPVVLFGHLISIRQLLLGRNTRGT